MKSKTIGIAATTGLFGVAVGAFFAPPASSVAQQTGTDYASPSATPQQKPEGHPNGQCPRSGSQGGPADTAFNGAPRNFRDVSFDGPPRDGRGGGFDGPPGGGPGGRGGPSGREGRPPGPPPRNGAESEDGHAHGPMLSEMIDQLNLSDTQKEKITKVLDFEREKMEALHEQKVKIQTQTRTNLEAVLTAEQKQQLTKMEAQMPDPNDGPPGGRRGPRGGGPGGPGGPGERGGPRGGGRGGR